MAGIRNPNNPETVPPILAAIDPVQEGTPRIIHPIGMLVGSPLAVAEAHLVASQTPQGYIEVPADGRYVDVRGTPYRFKAGTRLALARAATFPDLAHLIDAPVGVVSRAIVPPENKAFVVPERRRRQR